MSPDRPSGYSGTPLKKKLGIKDHDKLAVYGCDEDYRNLVGLPVDTVIETVLSEDSSYSFIHLFFTQLEDLATHYPAYYDKLEKEGMMWISWPKRSAKVDTDLNRDLIRNYILERGLVDVKVASVNEKWSALKFVFRVKDRGR